MQRTTRIASAALLAVAAMTNHAYAQVACTAGKIPITFTGKALTNSVTNSGDGSIARHLPEHIAAYIWTGCRTAGRSDGQF